MRIHADGKRLKFVYNILQRRHDRMTREVPLLSPTTHHGWRVVERLKFREQFIRVGIQQMMFKLMSTDATYTIISLGIKFIALGQIFFKQHEIELTIFSKVWKFSHPPGKSKQEVMWHLEGFLLVNLIGHMLILTQIHANCDFFSQTSNSLCVRTPQQFQAQKASRTFDSFAAAVKVPKPVGPDNGFFNFCRISSNFSTFWPTKCCNTTGYKIQMEITPHHPLNL